MSNNDARKFSDYNACTAPEANALLVITGNTAGNNKTFYVTPGVLFSNSPVDFVVSNNKVLSSNTLIIRRKITPDTSTDIVQGGTIWFDDNYIYVATSNNVIKRAALSSF